MSIPQPEPNNRLPSEILRTRLPELRAAEGRRWSQREVARRMRTYGFDNWHPATIANVESGARKLSVDELVGLAFVLGVSPVSLITAQGFSRERVTPNTVTGAHEIWQWMTYRRAEGGGEPGIAISAHDRASQRRVYEAAMPHGEAAAEQTFPGLGVLRRETAELEAEAVAAYWLRQDPDWRELGTHRGSRARVRANLDAIRGEVEVMIQRLDAKAGS